MKSKLTRPKNLFSRRLFIGLILAIIVGIGIFVARSRSTGSETPTITVTRQNLEERLTFSGEITADEKVTLRFPTGGQIAWVGVKEGDYVQKYQTIASLDQRILKKTLDKYLAAYKKSRNAFDENKDVYKDSVISDTIKRLIENSQADLNSSVLDVEIQDITMKLANLWTPIEGIVTKAPVTIPGVIINTPTQAEFEIVNPKTVYFSASVDQTELSRLQDGSSGDLVLDAYPGETLPGHVTNISFSPRTDETGTVYEIKFVFPTDNSHYKYRLGMTGDLSFVTARRQEVLSVPIKYVKTEGDKKYVWVLKNNVKEKVYVETDLEADNLVEIKSGLTEGDIITN